MEDLIRHALIGHPVAQVNLALHKLKGDGCPQDHVGAIYWLYKARENKSPKAMFLLGMCYKNGTGVNPDPSMAAHFFSEFKKYENTPPQEPDLNAPVDTGELLFKSVIDQFAFFRHHARFEGEEFHENYEYSVYTMYTFFEKSGLDIDEFKNQALPTLDDTEKVIFNQMIDLIKEHYL